MVDPSLPFLRGYGHVVLLDCCGGILLCRGWDRTMKHRVYIACNPATQEIWAALPVPDRHEPQPPLLYKKCIACLCFNPAVPGSFAVSVLFLANGNVEEVDVYSSDTREWTSMATGWGPGIELLGGQPGRFFLNGTLHFVAGNLIVTVDMDGSTSRTIQMPPEVLFSFIRQSQGHLYCMLVDCESRMSVWVLEDYDSGQWTLKHTASVLELLGRPHRKPGEFYRVVAIHPERNLLFLNGRLSPEKTLMSYDMDNKKLHVICTIEEYAAWTFHPYIPCFAEQPSVAQ